jgi:pimeloyl-ACP methyl ester carboxylesterase
VIRLRAWECVKGRRATTKAGDPRAIGNYLDPLTDRYRLSEAAEAIARGILNALLVVFKRSGHMPFVEEPERYLEARGSFLGRCAT